MQTMIKCKTCLNGKPEQRHHVCMLTGKTCGVKVSEVDEDCKNYEQKPKYFN